MLCTGMVIPAQVEAQCGSPISSFPYSEGFENAAVWTSGGTLSDWAWGTPAHPQINSAGGGVNSWCVGGLTGSFYNFGELSWLQSPCFDMSALDHPWISFKIFWECERQYDGMNLQMSLNNGTTWTNVGAWGDPVDCLNDNWFNAGSITNLTSATPKHGWSGRTGGTVGSCQGGFGSGTWVEAKHCIPPAANQSQVLFRFLFGAGTQCNDYDGVAVDDILIQEAPATTADFTFTCVGNTVTFQDASTSCPTNRNWDFGDPGSGAQNTAQGISPSHTYATPGTYQVTLTVIGPCSDPGTITIPVRILDVAVNATDPMCFGGLGSASAVVSGVLGNETYLWQPGNQSTASVNGLAAGGHSVTVSAPDACTSTTTIMITEPTEVIVTAMPDFDVCPGSSATLTANGSGGTGLLTYAWMPSGPNITPAAAGTYTVVATDANGCASAPDDVNVGLSGNVVAQMDVSQDMGCTPLCIQLSDITPGATQSEWDFGDGSSAMGAVVTHCYQAGSFEPMLTSTDANGCSGVVTGPMITADASPTAGFIPLPDLVYLSEPNVEFQNTSSGAVEWEWTFGDPVFGTATGSNVEFAFIQLGCHPITQVVTSDAGCRDTTMVQVCVESEYTLFAPNTFTPNNDGYNDVFLPISSALRPLERDLTIFDRWGQVLFQGGKESQGWSGEGASDGVYAWSLRVRDAFGKVHTHNGHVTLLR